MLCVWWNFQGVIHWEFVSNGRGVDASTVFILNNWNEFMKLRDGYPALINQNKVLLQQDNARPHIARTTITKIQELGGIELLPHPAYSPDLEPSDYHLFRSMAHFLHRRNFENILAASLCR